MNREIVAKLKIMATGAVHGSFNAMLSRLSDVNKRAAAFNRQQSLLTRSTSELYATIGRFAAPAAFAYAAKQALTDFAALERQMTRIGITADASADQTAKAFERAQQIAKDLNYDGVAPAIEAIDTLVASGQSLEEAMAFLPSVLATAQASGAATSDIANTGLKAASALKIETAELQHAFDIMVAGGKAGQFELKDMAQYIPGLANSFASLGYDGEDGLKRLVAILQTIREDTGDASAAATQAQNVFGKMFSSDTSKKFADFGINLRKEMQAAAKSGEDAVSAFVRLSKEAIKGDLSRLPELFTDQEFRLGMQSLITSEESLARFLKLMNSAEVNGVVWRDVQRVMTDTQASIDKMSSSWETLKTSFGEAVAMNGGVQLMEGLTNSLDYHTAVNRGLEKNGVNGWMSRTGWGITSSQMDKDRMAIAGGYKEPEFLADYNHRLYDSGNVKASTGRQNQRVVVPEFPGSAGGQTPVPGRRPALEQPAVTPQGVSPSLQRAPAMAAMGQMPSVSKSVSDFFSVPTADQFREALKIDATGITQGADEAGRKVADGGREAGKQIEESAAYIRVAGYDVSTAIASAAQKLMDAARAINSMPVSGIAAARNSDVKADTGRSMPPPAFGPR